MILRIVGCVVALCAALPVCVRAQVDESPLDVQVVEAFPKIEWPDWVTGLDAGRPRDPRPLIVTGAGDGTNRIFIVSQYGSIHVFPNDPNADEMKTFLDIRDRVQYDDKENEEGLLGLAFHPNLQGERRVLCLLLHQGYGRIRTQLRYLDSEFRRMIRIAPIPIAKKSSCKSSSPIGITTAARSCSARMAILYVGLGDGGLANDPHGNGQNLGTLLGSILRIDVDHKDPGLELRDSERQSVRRQDGKARRNLGVRHSQRVADRVRSRDGHACGPATSAKTSGKKSTSSRAAATTVGTSAKASTRSAKTAAAHAPDLIDPIWEYHHDVGKSITGGNVYRGKQVPELDGGYIYADFVSGQIWALWYDEAKKQVTANRTITAQGLAGDVVRRRRRRRSAVRHPRRRHSQIRLAEDHGEPLKSPVRGPLAA